MKPKIGAFAGGLMFGIGLAISGMTQPAKIVGFFDFTGHWDPSLAFVMAGALAVYAPVYRRVVDRWSRPIWAESFSLPSRRDIDWRLLSGSALFGLGWGIGGYCPGPAVTSVGARSHDALIFGAAMLVGVGVYQLALRGPRASSARGETAAPEATVDG
ncbi:MAG: DUF6691 family protein [Polyangiales bacterium]